MGSILRLRQSGQLFSADHEYNGIIKNKDEDVINEDEKIKEETKKTVENNGQKYNDEKYKPSKAKTNSKPAPAR